MAACLPIGHAPLNPLARPFPADIEQPFAKADARRWNREPASVQGRERDFQSLAFLGDHVFARHAHVGEFHDAVVERAQSHEVAAIRDFQSGRIDIDNERSDLLALPAIDHFGRRPGHDHKHAGLNHSSCTKASRR